MGWNNEVKAAFERKELLGARYEAAKERCEEVYKGEKSKVERYIY